MSRQKVVIVGAGIFGMSTALWMLEDGSFDVIILDKSEVLPAPDAASTDLNKIIRAGDYMDPALAKLSLEAIDFWRRPEWEDTYHESGVMVISDTTSSEDREFVSRAANNLKSLGVNPTTASDAASIKALLPVPTAELKNNGGYLNHIGGWAEAGRATGVGLKRVKKLGGEVRGGSEAVGLVKDAKKIRGVKLKNGEVVEGDLVVIAAGAWTPAFFAASDVSLRLPDLAATGQSIACVELTPEEVQSYSKVPVILRGDTHFYVFPPNHERLMKMAIHAAGYTNDIPSPFGPQSQTIVSTPRTRLTHGEEGGAIPKAMAQQLRQCLGELYPDLAKKPFIHTRLCWYCDSVTGDWLIDYHPEYENLVIATGDSGHAFKFAPIIGQEILKVIRKEPSEWKDRWSFTPGVKRGADMRVGVRKPLKLDELCTQADLVPVH